MCVVALSTLCSVVIRVEDVNDNPPEIEITSFSSRIPEDAPPGTVVALMGVVCNYLDKETTPAKSGNLNLTITVLDANDNRPVFSKDVYTVSLDENAPNGTLVIKLNATDKDEGLNSEIEYNFGKTQKKKVHDTFELDSITGEIRVKGNVDFEETELYRLDLQASDKGQPPWTAESRVVIKIKDVNDNKPDIEVTSLSSLIPEDSKPGTVIALISVVDKDSGVNGKVICKVSQDVPFDLRPSLEENMYSLVTKGRLDRETVSRYDITITATDCGEPQLSTVKTLSVQVSDVNDNRPVFSQNPFELYLIENNTPGAPIFSVSAVDDDLNENAAITYHIVRGDGLQDAITSFLNVHSDNGQITALKSFDFETLKTFQFQVVASDSGTPSLSSNVTIIIVLDSNDNHPFFSEEVYSVKIPENVERHRSVIVIKANDLDEGVNGEIEYFFGSELDPKVYDTFSLDKDTGEIRVKGEIDFENIEVYKLDVHATDKGQPPMSTDFEITDINDHSPTFPESEQRLEIAESTPPGTRFQIHAARDPDFGAQSLRKYTLNPTDLFDIEVRDSEEDKMPFLVLKRPLDREQKAEHRLLLTAVDGGSPAKSGSLNLTITVLDTNDNRPVFSKDVYTVSLDENAPIGTFVVKLNATDLDEGSNGNIEYNFGKIQKKKVHDTFELDSITGEIRVKGNVDFEETELYRLDLQASDKGQPPLKTESRVMIKIKDVNDNKPDIEVTSLSSLIPEDSKPGTVIALISVVDKDSGVNGKVICKVSQDVPFDLTPSLEENMYSLVTKGRLDRETVSRYEITITATDCGEPQLSTVKTLSVQVSDVNDNTPVFSQNPFELYLIENNTPGAEIFSVSAVDDDLNENAAITYKILRGDGLQDAITSFLNVNSDNGQITALKSFDFETLKTFQFQVVASDSGTPSLSSNVTVNVFILDQNDNAPVILYPLSSNGSAQGVEDIPRNVNAGHLVTKVRAYDADIGYNGWLLFSLQEVTDHSLFALDRYTGQIRTLRSFTETDEAEHKLLILVKDNGNVSLSATATVVVKLVEPKEAFAASDVKSAAKDDEDSNVIFYLMITLGAVSVLFLVSIIVLIGMQCSRSTDYTSKYLPETNYDGTLCHSIQYRSGEKRYMLVGPRMSIGSTIVPGSHANTLVFPDRRRTSEEVRARFYLKLFRE
uniref:Si:ch73-379j16.2 n=1 Tax=Neolamprologus brichardi TaxID=32507 RepID=A0A3Q4GSN7_NEOBR